MAAMETGGSMAVEVRVPSLMQKHTQGQKVLSYDAQTIGTLIATIDGDYPGFREQIVEDGEILRFVNIFLNDEDIRFLERMETPLRDGDVVAILPALAGGALGC